MRKRWIKWVLWIAISPFLLFFLVMFLLYLPPIQNFVCDEATAYASRKTGMQIAINRIDLRFPLNLKITDVQVVSRRDTLLQVKHMSFRMKAFPLLSGRVEIEYVRLRNTGIYSRDLIRGMCLRGWLSDVKLDSRIDFNRHTAIIDYINIKNSHLKLTMLPDTRKKDNKPSTPWRILFSKLNIKNVAFGYQSLPKDNMHFYTYLKEAEAMALQIDTHVKARYGVNRLCINEGTVKYDSGSDTGNPRDFNPSHLYLKKVYLGLNSVYYCGAQMHATVTHCAFRDRSGVSIVNLQTRLMTDSKQIYLPRFYLLTPQSEIRMSGYCLWRIAKTFGKEKGLILNLDASIGKSDMLILAKVLPKRLQRSYPSRPLIVHAGLVGNMHSMHFSRLNIQLPGAFFLNGTGNFLSLADKRHRSADVNLKVQVGDLNFLSGLINLPYGRFVIPNNLNFYVHGFMKGEQYGGHVEMGKNEGQLIADGKINTLNKRYDVTLKAVNLQLHHFFPKDSVSLLSANASVRGQGFDIKSKRTQGTCKMAIGYLGYKRYPISNVHLDASLKSSLLTAKLSSNNEWLKMLAYGEYRLNLKTLRGKVNMNVDNVDLYRLGMASSPLKDNFAFKFNGESRADSLTGHLSAGDMKLDIGTDESLSAFLHQASRFGDVLMKQVKNKKLNHVALRHALPSTVLICKAGKKNPLTNYLATEHIGFDNLNIHIKMSPHEGLNCDAKIYGLRRDTILLDSIFLATVQDTSHISINGLVINGKKNPVATFKASLKGEIESTDGKLLVEYMDDQGNKGLLLGVHFTPDKAGTGILFNFIPDDPIVAFHKFHFLNNNNTLRLQSNGRLFANIDLVDQEGIGLRMHSVVEDSTSLQNINIEIRQIKLDEITRLLPYSPPYSGTFSCEANYVQVTKKKMSASIEGNIDNLSYAHQQIGNVTVGATWLPGEDGRHYVNGYVSHDKKEVMLADGILDPSKSGKDSLFVNTTFEHFPLKITNAFITNQMASLCGDIDGGLHLRGTTDKPIINGTLKLDSVVLASNKAGIQFRFDNRPVEIKDSRLLFDKFAIYTTGKEPFTIDGNVDFKNLNLPTANLKMDAKNYVLVNVSRKYGSLLYGKMFVDFNSTLQGPVKNLVMRGNMNIKNNTDITYVLEDTPLGVQNRLADLVTFTDFSDTTKVYNPNESSIQLGGFDVRMALHIDPSVQLKADLSADRSSRVAFEGGGDLYFRYSPQGDMTLTGRYSLTGGTIKYALPVIPLKEFSIASGSYVEWSGNVYNPRINFNAIEQVRASVAQDDGSSQMVNFDVGLSMKDQLKKPNLLFTLNAPDNYTVQNELAVMSTEERNKQAIVMLTTGIYLQSSGKTSKLNMGNTLNSVLSNQINSLAGSMKNGSFLIGVENRDDTSSGGTATDYSFRYSQRLFNNRIRMIMGGRISTGKNTNNSVGSFIDDISLEYRLDNSGTCFIQLFHNKNYESVLDGEITETGLGVILHKRMDNMRELFIFKKVKKQE